MATIELDTAFLKQAVDKFLPQTEDELVKWVCDRSTAHRTVLTDKKNIQYYLKSYPLKLVAERRDDGNTFFRVCLPVVGLVLSASVRGVEACCAMSFFHTFSVWEHLHEAEVKILMDAIIRQIREDGFLSGQRLIVNMVQNGASYQDPLSRPTVHAEPDMKYKPLWTYFHKNAARVNTMLMPNPNTGRVIHHMEVIFTPEFPKG